MHFIIIMILIGCFILFPSFRRIVGVIILLFVIGLTAIYGPLFLFTYWNQDLFNLLLTFAAIGCAIYMFYHYNRVVESREESVYSNIYEGTDKIDNTVSDNDLNNFDFMGLESKYWAMAEDDWHNNNDEAESIRGLRSKLITLAGGNVEQAKSQFMKIRVIQLQRESSAIDERLIALPEYSQITYLLNEGAPVFALLIFIITFKVIFNIIN